MLGQLLKHLKTNLALTYNILNIDNAGFQLMYGPRFKISLFYFWNIWNCYCKIIIVIIVIVINYNVIMYNVIYYYVIIVIVIINPVT